MEKNKKHLNIDEIYEAVKMKLLRISKAPVYQNIKLQTEEGLFREVNVIEVARFEANMETNHNIICRNCSKIKDFVLKVLIHYSLKMYKKIKNFTIDTTSTNYYVICNICKGD